MNWYNEAPQWQQQGNTVVIQTAPDSDFWRVTSSGVIKDSGHFYYQRQTGDFTASVKFSGNYNTLYDQAGLMVRMNESQWIKSGIEFIDGAQFASAVVTRDYSDWSMISLSTSPTALWLRLKRQGPTIEIEYALDGQHYQLFRQAYLSTEAELNVGLMCASPVGPGFSVTFEDFTIQTL